MKLYVVPTPIGNLKDITLRSLEILSNVNYIICEDTRRTRVLLDHYGIKNKRLISYFSPREEQKIPIILKILEKEDIALTVDSGMPGISDPGYRLIKSSLDYGAVIEVLPGPSAFLTALIGSGLPTDKFLFLGFLPKKGLENYFQKFKNLNVTIIFYESSKRILKTLKILKNVFNTGQTVIARELSKIHENYLRGEINELIKILETQELKGELTIIFNQR
ncbi:MAG: ribosomal RNA small subunit methyltransferase I [Candidatus Parcubacteria bacterium]|nr:MAG: ribosomal RNA small subunit methyltransferase I [Candidatus Parcubacteria bacterium]